jgi:hypothetical protein
MIFTMIFTIYEPQDNVLIPNVSPRYIQLWHRAHLSWYCAAPVSLEAKVSQYAQTQANTIEKLTRQIEELKAQIDPTRLKHLESKASSTHQESKSYSEILGRGLFAKNLSLRSALLSKRVPSGPNTHLIPGSSPESFHLGNPTFSTSISSELNNILNSSNSDSSSFSSEHTQQLRGDSPFSRFRTGYSGSNYSR